jgi:hypothetical protein
MYVESPLAIAITAVTPKATAKPPDTLSMKPIEPPEGGIAYNEWDRHIMIIHEPYVRVTWLNIAQRLTGVNTLEFPVIGQGILPKIARLIEEKELVYLIELGKADRNLLYIGEFDFGR